MVPSCAEGGVLGVLPGIIGVMQAIEAVKLIVGIGEPLIGRLVHFDALTMKFREFKLRRDPKCPVCSETPDHHRSDRLRPVLWRDRRRSCGRGRGGNQVPAISASAICKRRLDAKGENILLLDVREKVRTRHLAHPRRETAAAQFELPARMSELDSAQLTSPSSARTGPRSVTRPTVTLQRGRVLPNCST